MTGFLLFCAAMILLAVGWIVWPVIRPPKDVDPAQTRGERRWVVIVVAVVVPIAALALYLNLTTWKWNDPEIAQALTTRDELLDLEQRTRDNPDSVDAWSELGRGYGGIGHYPKAIQAFEQAYRLSQGRNPDVISNLAEALALSDAANMDGRAGQLFEEALALSPTHPKALFYGSVAAMRAGKLETARDRLQALLMQNPPEQIRPALERQIQDLEAQIAEGSSEQPSTTSRRVVKVNVTLSPQLRSQVKDTQTLFVLARDAKAGGPPLAVERHSAKQLPLSVELTEDDAMMPSRTIASMNELVIVARLSNSGTPQQQSGDYYGEVLLSIDPSRADQTYSVDVTIDRQAQ